MFIIQCYYEGKNNILQFYIFTYFFSSKVIILSNPCIIRFVLLPPFIHCHLLILLSSFALLLLPFYSLLLLILCLYLILFLSFFFSPHHSFFFSSSPYVFIFYFLPFPPPLLIFLIYILMFFFFMFFCSFVIFFSFFLIAKSIKMVRSVVFELLYEYYNKKHILLCMSDLFFSSNLLTQVISYIIYLILQL